MKFDDIKQHLDELMVIQDALHDYMHKYKDSSHIFSSLPLSSRQEKLLTMHGSMAGTALSSIENLLKEKLDEGPLSSLTGAVFQLGCCSYGGEKEMKREEIIKVVLPFLKDLNTIRNILEEMRDKYHHTLSAEDPLFELHYERMVESLNELVSLVSFRNEI